MSGNLLKLAVPCGLLAAAAIIAAPNSEKPPKGAVEKTGAYETVISDDLANFDEKVLRHYLAGIQWAMGDFEAGVRK